MMPDAADRAILRDRSRGNRAAGDLRKYPPLTRAPPYRTDRVKQAIVRDTLFCGFIPRFVGQWRNEGRRTVIPQASQALGNK